MYGKCLQATVLFPVRDSLVTVVIGPNSTGGQICVAMEDTCTTGPDTCIQYTIAQPSAPGSVTGITQLCQGNSTWYSTAAQAGITGYNWTVTAGLVTSNTDSNAIQVQVGSGTGSVCLSINDGCAWSDTTCLEVTGSSQPSLANAGVDKTVCTGQPANLGASSPTVGSGTWTIVSSPGAGTFSSVTDHNATYTASAPGVHVLRWTVTSAGCPSTSDEMSVTVNITPTAQFSTQNVCEDAPVAFNDQSTGNGATINSWQWDMNGNGVDNHISQNPIHLYSNSGTFTVRQIVNAQGCADTLYKDVFVNPKPTMDIDADNVCLKEEVIFVNNNSVSTGAIVQTEWDYGDGSPVDMAGAGAPNYANTHEFPQPGNYSVTCTATSDSTCVNSDVIQVVVYHLPEAKFTFNNACQYQTTEFFDLSTVTGANVEAWSWSFGDGSDSAFVKSVEHDYDVNGFVPVSLHVESSLGCKDDTVMDVEIFPTPVTQFNYTNKVCLGDVMDMESVSSISYGSIDTWDWIVADSFLYDTKEAQHLFGEIGTYSVKLTTTSDRGCKSSLEKLVPVFDVPIADFTVQNTCMGEEIEFVDLTKFVGSVASYEWNFGDATPNGDKKNPVHVYDTYGTYNVELVVASFQGCEAEKTREIEVYERLSPAFKAVPDSGCSPLTVYFLDSTESVTGRSWERKWVLGNGFEQLDTAEYVYQNYSGKHKHYNVTLQVLTDQGCYSEVSLDSHVYVLPQPRADFASLPDNLEELKTTRPIVQFNNMSAEANRYRWYFGDGETSTLHNPSHEYKEAGEYEVTMVAQNIYGCQDSLSKTAIVSHVNVLYIPSAFTPNGDGKNEIFIIEGLEDIEEMSLEIFDRWGNQVFYGKGLNVTWDGTDGQSKIVQQGVYLYRVQYVDNKGEEFEHLGNVSVLGIQ